MQTDYYLDLTISEIQRSIWATEKLGIGSRKTKNSNCNQNWVDAWKLVFEVYWIFYSVYFFSQIQEIGCCCLSLNELFYSLLCPHPFKYAKFVSLYLFVALKTFLSVRFAPWEAALLFTQMYCVAYRGQPWRTKFGEAGEGPTCTPRFSGTARPRFVLQCETGPRQAGPHVYKCSPISILLFSHHC